MSSSNVLVAVETKNAARLMFVRLYHYGTHDALTVSLHKPGKDWGSGRLAFAWAEPLECRLTFDNDDDHPSIWIGGASFDLSDDEADEIARQFGPRGLRDERVSAEQPATTAKYR